MLTFLLILGIIISILLVLVILIQNPKGGGLASNFSSGNQIFGVQKTTDIIEKLTWVFAAVVVIVSLLASSYNGPAKKVNTAAGPTDELLDRLSKTKGSVATPPPAQQQQQQQQPK